MLPYLGLLLLGLALGAIGTLIGAGGGFLLVPLLLLLYPSESAQVITSISLAVVFLNALSDSVRYARLKRIDYRAGSWFALGSVPGAALGVMTTTIVPRGTFDALLGTVLLGVAAFLWRRPANPEARENLVAADAGAAWPAARALQSRRDASVPRWCGWIPAGQPGAGACRLVRQVGQNAGPRCGRRRRVPTDQPSLRTLRNRPARGRNPTAKRARRRPC